MSDKRNLQEAILLLATRVDEIAEQTNRNMLTIKAHIEDLKVRVLTLEAASGDGEPIYVPRD